MQPVTGGDKLQYSWKIRTFLVRTRKALHRKLLYFKMMAFCSCLLCINIIHYHYQMRYLESNLAYPQRKGLCAKIWVGRKINRYTRRFKLKNFTSFTTLPIRCLYWTRERVLVVSQGESCENHKSVKFSPTGKIDVKWSLPYPLTLALIKCSKKWVRDEKLFEVNFLKITRKRKWRDEKRKNYKK